MTIKQSVLIADDHKLMRAGLRSLLSTEAGIEVVGEADNGKDAISIYFAEAQRRAHGSQYAREPRS